MQQLEGCDSVQHNVFLFITPAQRIVYCCNAADSPAGVRHHAHRTYQPRRFISRKQHGHVCSHSGSLPRNLSEVQLPEACTSVEADAAGDSGQQHISIAGSSQQLLQEGFANALPPACHSLAGVAH